MAMVVWTIRCDNDDDEPRGFATKLERKGGLGLGAVGSYNGASQCIVDDCLVLHPTDARLNRRDPSTRQRSIPTTRHRW